MSCVICSVCCKLCYISINELLFINDLLNNYIFCFTAHSSQAPRNYVTRASIRPRVVRAVHVLADEGAALHPSSTRAMPKMSLCFDNNIT